MPGLEFATTPLTLPAWAVGSAAALFIVIAVITLSRAGAKVAGAILRVTFVLAVCGAVFVLLQQNALRERLAERRSLDLRAAELAARAVTPGSPLACLDAVAGDAVETACEEAVFASPATVAAAVSYVTARLALLPTRSTMRAAPAAATRARSRRCASRSRATATASSPMCCRCATAARRCCATATCCSRIPIACRPTCATGCSTIMSSATPPNGRACRPPARRSPRGRAPTTRPRPRRPPRPPHRRRPPPCRCRRNTIFPRPPRSRRSAS